MKISNRSVWRLPMFIGYGAIILSMVACAALSGGTQQPQEQVGSLQLDDGVVKVKAENGDWVPVAGKATFELTGKLESTDPWTVSGKTFSTNETTKIEDGLQVGDIVHVRGAVLDDDTWVAYSIERADEKAKPTIILIGVVTSVDPWVVNGITLNVTSETKIQGEIKPGMIVRVEILLMDDGTWQVLSIAPLGTPTETSGCATVIAVVTSVTGNEVQFLGWPMTITLQVSSPTPVPQVNENNQNNQGDEDNENDDEGSGSNEHTVPTHGGTPILTGQTVLAVVCMSEDGTFIIAQIIILGGEEESGSTTTPGEKVLVCHKPGKNPHTLSLPPAAVPAHLGHGDTLGACP